MTDTTETDFPYTAIIRWTYNREEFWNVTVVCPHCGKKHTHGWDSSEAEKVQHRVSHCGVSGYYVVQTGPTPKQPTPKNKPRILKFQGGPLDGRTAPGNHTLYRSAINGKSLPKAFGDRWIMIQHNEAVEARYKQREIYVKRAHAYVWAPDLLEQYRESLSNPTTNK